MDAGLSHLVRPASLPEERSPGEDPAAFARRLALEKASAVICDPGEVILGADTIVVQDDEVFGKPRNELHAREILRQLSGRDHWVYTGICLRSRWRLIQDLAATRVAFCELTQSEIDEYVSTGEPMDKAGAYAIQGRASKFASCIEGSYSNVVGLPVSLVYQHLKAFWTEYPTV